MARKNKAPAGPVDDPTDLTRADYFTAFKRTLKEVKEDDVPGLAAGAAFKIFMSIFPSLLTAVAIFGLVMTPGEIADLLAEAQGFLPETAIKVLQKPLNDLTQAKESTAGFAAVAGIATAVVAATSAAISLMKALSRAYDVKETRKFVRQRLVAVALTLALIAALLGIVLLLVAGRHLQASLLPGVAPPLSWAVTGARFALALALLVLLFAFVYWIGPNRDHPSWVWLSPGSLFGVVGWLIVSGGFTLYTQSEFGDGYGRTYAGIAGVVVLLLWLQMSMLVILIGAEFNAEIERMRALHLRVGEGAGFAAPAATALVPHDAEAGVATITEAQTGAHAVHPPPSDVEPTVEMPAPTLIPPPSADATVELPPRPADATVEIPARPLTPPDTGALAVALRPPSSIRTIGSVAAGATALAAMLGFARRRHRG